MKVFVLTLFLCIAFTFGQDLDNEACERPLFHGKTEDNWPLAGVPGIKTKARYSLKIKGLRRGGGNTFTPNTPLKVFLKVNRPKGKKTTDFIRSYTIDAKNNVTSCDDGGFKPNGKKGDKPGRPKVSEGCPTLASLEGTKDERRARVLYTAPSCGCVTFQAEIMNQDRILISDYNDEVADKYRVLTKTICAA